MKYINTKCTKPNYSYMIWLLMIIVYRPPPRRAAEARIVQQLGSTPVDAQARDGGIYMRYRDYVALCCRTSYIISCWYAKICPKELFTNPWGV